MIVPEVVAEPEPIIIPDVITEPEAEPIIIEDAEVVPTMDDLGFDLNELDMSTMPNEEDDFDATMNEIENEINLDKMAESEALEDITIPDEMTPELDAAIDDGSDILMDSIDDENDIMIDTIGDDDSGDTNIEVDTITEESNPFASKVDDSPNKQLTEEEIAALFASL